MGRKQKEVVYEVAGRERVEKNVCEQETQKKAQEKERKTIAI